MAFPMPVLMGEIVVSKLSVFRRSGEPLGPNPIEDDRPFHPILKPPVDPKKHGRRQRAELDAAPMTAVERGGCGHGSPPSETVTSVTTVTALISLGFSVTICGGVTV